MQRRGLTLPLLIGGATTSRQHTAVRIAPAYDGLDRARARRLPGGRRRVQTCSTRTGPRQLDADNRAEQERLREQHASQQQQPLLTLARGAALTASRSTSSDLPVPAFTGVAHRRPGDRRAARDDRLAVPVPGLGAEGQVPGDPGPAGGARAVRRRQHAAGRDHRGRLAPGPGRYGFWPAHADGDDIVLGPGRPPRASRCCGSRPRKPDGRANRCLADYVAPGRATTSAGSPSPSTARRPWPRSTRPTSDDYRAIMVKALADRLAEAFAEYIHLQARRDWFEPDAEAGARGPARRAVPRHPPGPRLPGQPGPQPESGAVRPARRRRTSGMALTESFAMSPAASVSGLIFAQPVVAVLHRRPDRPGPGRATTRAAAAWPWPKSSAGCGPTSPTTRIDNGQPGAGDVPGRPRWRAKNRAALSASNLGTSPCPPALACSVFSLEAKASNNARPDWRPTKLVVPLEQELDRDGDPSRRLGQGFMPEAAEDRRGDPGLGRGQRHPDPGALHDAPEADRPPGADLRQLLQGVQGRLPFRHGPRRQGEVEPGDGRADRLARRLSLPQDGDVLLVLRCPRAAAVPGRVDGGGVESAAGHEGAGTAHDSRCSLVLAATVRHQHQGRAIGAGCGRPEQAGDLTQGEIAFDDTVRRCLRVKCIGCCLSGLPGSGAPGDSYVNRQPCRSGGAPKGYSGHGSHLLAWCHGLPEIISPGDGRSHDSR